MTARRNRANLTHLWQNASATPHRARSACKSIRVAETDRLSAPCQITGNQLFVKVNAARFAIGAALATTPPAEATLTAVPVTALEITNAGGVISLKLATSDAPEDGSMLRAASPVKAGIRRCPGLALLGTLDSPVNNKIDISTAYKNRFGSPAVGSKVFVAVNNNDQGCED